MPTISTISEKRHPLTDAHPSVNFEEWYHVHGEALYLFIMLHAPSTEDAEDLLQSTYLGAWENRASFGETAQLKTWLKSIALDVLRKDMGHAPDCGCVVEPIDDHDDALVETRTPERYISDKQRLAQLMEIAGSLSPAQQSMIELLFVENLSYVQVAAALGIPVGTVRSRLSRFRAKLEKHLAQRPQGECIAKRHCPDGAPRSMLRSAPRARRARGSAARIRTASDDFNALCALCNALSASSLPQKNDAVPAMRCGASTASMFAPAARCASSLR
jgi:RNA polymerase sigma factor (sigma-70 family)